MAPKIILRFVHRDLEFAPIKIGVVLSQAKMHHFVAKQQGLLPIEVIVDDGEGNEWRWSWNPSLQDFLLTIRGA